MTIKAGDHMADSARKAIDGALKQTRNQVSPAVKRAASPEAPAGAAGAVATDSTAPID